MTTDANATRLQIDLGAIVANWRSLKKKPSPLGRGLGEGRPASTNVGSTATPHPNPLPKGEREVGAVLKADAYGHGATHVAPALFAAGCRHFFVAHLSEALAIREHVPGALLAVLNGLWPGTEPIFIHHDIRPVLGSLAEIDAWTSAARTAGRRLPALLHIDTGMNRLGLSPAEVDILAADPHRLDGIIIDYVMTHLVSAEIPGDPVNQDQCARFAAACDRLPPAPRSLANSSGLFLGPAFASHLARPGAALYGVNPTPGQPNPMRPAASLHARILQVRDVPVGGHVGYNGQWTARRKSRIATVSVGYADGFMRSLTNRAAAYFDGSPIPLVGRVSMDLTTFDVTDAPAAGPGAWLELISPNMPVDAVAERAGTNGYEVLTSLGRRYTRTYLPA
jgi:alanine racemase